MVVIATPNPYPQVPVAEPQISIGQLNPVPCATQNVISAPVSTVNGAPVYSRMRAVTFTQGQCGTIDWQLHDKDGHPVNLESCGITDGSMSVSGADFKVVLRLKEQLSLGNERAPIEVEAAVLDASEGRVQAEIVKGMTDLPVV